MTPFMRKAVVVAVLVAACSQSSGDGEEAASSPVEPQTVESDPVVLGAGQAIEADLDGPSEEMVTLQDDPFVGAVRYPRPEYEGNPWSQWGQGIILPDGRVLSTIGDHLGADGNSYLFVFDPDTGVMTRFADVRKGGGFEYVGAIMPIGLFAPAYRLGLDIAQGSDVAWSMGCRVVGQGHAMMFFYAYAFNRADKADVDRAKEALEKTNQAVLELGGIPWKAEAPAQKQILSKMDPGVLSDDSTVFAPATIFRPLSANFSAIALPMPLLAPVTIATFPEMEDSMEGPLVV